MVEEQISTLNKTNRKLDEMNLFDFYTLPQRSTEEDIGQFNQLLILPLNTSYNSDREFDVVAVHDGDVLCRIHPDADMGNSFSLGLGTDEDNLWISCLRCGLICITPNHKQHFVVEKNIGMFAITLKEKP